MTGGETGLSVFQYAGQPIGATFTGTGDTFNGALSCPPSTSTPTAHPVTSRCRSR